MLSVTLWLRNLRSVMREISILLVSLFCTIVRLLGPGGAKAIVAENLLLKQQLLVL